MPTRELHNLTDREREVLRLLANGHDIKSAARELSISVSAVADRLRHARRKLGASTSRQAARMLADGETAPRFAAHTFSGQANPPGPSQQRRVKVFAGIGIAMLILIASGALYFPLNDARPAEQGRARVQPLAAHAPPRPAPAEVTFAQNPKVLCRGPARAQARQGPGFHLKCAGSRRSPHAIPITVERANLLH